MIRERRLPVLNNAYTSLSFKFAAATLIWSAISFRSTLTLSLDCILTRYGLCNSRISEHAHPTARKGKVVRPFGAAEMVRSLLTVGVPHAGGRDLHVIAEELHLVLDALPGVRAQYVAAAARAHTFLRL